jgi:hypothetical protein
VSDFTRHITAGFSEGFLQSEAASPTTLVPDVYDVSLAGLPFLIDTKYIDDFTESSIELLRPQQDSSNEPGEQSVNPEDFWRRSQHSWHHGAGQIYLDREDDIDPPDRQRYRRSKGVDVWTRDQLSLLPTTDEKRNSSNTNLFLQPAGTRLYHADGNDLRFTSTATDATWTSTAVTGTPATPVLSVASDGFHVWAMYASGIWVTNTGITTATEAVTNNVTGQVAWVKGRLIVSNGASVYNVTDLVGSAALPTVLWTHQNSDFSFVGFADGNSVFYGAGNSGDKAEIYRFGIKEDGSGLTQGIQAGKLPDGELVYSIAEYLGFIFLGTSLGVRMCASTGDGDLIIGDLVETGNPVRCFEPQGRFMWFGWTNYDGTSTGLGRLYLRVLTDPNALLPAYASDLMVTGQANITSLATFGNKRYFGVSGDGFYGEDTVLEPTGTIDSGWVTFGLSDAKIGMYLEVRYAPNFQGSVETSIAVDGSTSYQPIGTHTESSEYETKDTFQLGELRGERFEIRQTLNRDASVSTLGPALTGHTFKAQPGVQTRERIIVPLLIFVSEDVYGSVTYRNPEEDVAIVRELCRTQSVTTLGIGNVSRSVVVENYRVQHDRKDSDSGAWSTTVLTVCKTV